MIPIICSLIAALAGIASVWLTGRQNRKIGETHKQVTVNGGKSDPPTVLDYISDVKAEVRGVAAMFTMHLADAAVDKQQLAEVRAHLGLD